MKQDLELEKKVALTISPIFIAFAAFSLPIMVLNDLKCSFSNEIFGIIGLVSILSASLLIDWIFDKKQYTLKDRFKMMNGGYFFFSIVISLMCVSIFLIYNIQEGNNLTWGYIPIFGVGGLTFLKIMSHDEDDNFLIFFFISNMGHSGVYMFMKFQFRWHQILCII